MITKMLTKFQAEVLLSSMQNIIDQYGCVSVAECKYILGKKHFLLREFHLGWTNLYGAKICHSDNNGHYPRYYVEFPEPTDVIRHLFSKCAIERRNENECI